MATTASRKWRPWRVFQSSKNDTKDTMVVVLAVNCVDRSFEILELDFPRRSRVSDILVAIRKHATQPTIRSQHYGALLSASNTSGIATPLNISKSVARLPRDVLVAVPAGQTMHAGMQQALRILAHPQIGPSAVEPLGIARSAWQQPQPQTHSSSSSIPKRQPRRRRKTDKLLDADLDDTVVDSGSEDPTNDVWIAVVETTHATTEACLVPPSSTLGAQRGRAY